MPFSVEWSKLPFPHKISGHVAVVWRDSVIVWGGNNSRGKVPPDVVFMSVAGGDWVSMKTNGKAPEESRFTKAQVVNDKMYILDFGDMTKNLINALDLKSLTWEVVAPRNSLSEVSDGFTSWVHGGMIYFFGGGCSKQGCIGMGGGCGGASNLLYCYNSINNTWDWPLHGGEVPSPREDLATVIVDDMVYLFGGNRYMGGPFQVIADMEYNDLYTLDMRSMMWRKVHGNCDQGEAPHPKLSPDHTLTKISKSAAVLYAALGGGDLFRPECWILNLDNAMQQKEPTSMWTKIQTPFPRVVHASVLEPASQRLWVIGGEDNSEDGFTSDVIKMSINTVPLKTLAIDCIARHLKANDPKLTLNNCPERLLNEIEEHRSKIKDAIN